MEVVDFLDVDESKMQIVTDSGRIPDEKFFPRESQLEISRLPESDITEAGPVKLTGRLEETPAIVEPASNDVGVDQSRCPGENLNPQEKPEGSGSSATSVCSSLKPDFSKIKGEICLDKLSIRELHETFKATFGRETTVKDKVWLKRRIAMGLTNSCDVPATAFIIKDGKVVEEEICTNAGNIVKESVVGDENKNLQTSHDGEIKDRQYTVGEKFGYCSQEETQKESWTAKRIRKPTKRYIEELSVVESREHGGKSITACRKSRPAQMFFKSYDTLKKNVSPNGRTVTTRLVSLGGSGVQIPCVSRVRRSRPRKDINDLMIFNPAGMSEATTPVKKVQTVLGAQVGNDNGHILKSSHSSEKTVQLPLVISEKDNSNQDMESTDQGKYDELKSHGSPKDACADSIATVPTSKGGIRRKHHRAWTLSEVMKLVEGVSKYGAGRWSEIKRLAFASYSYRTSVDLKDKWRNLLKASFAETQPDKGALPRKHSSVSIPAPILSRVRELAVMHAQVPPKLSSSKLVGSSERVVNEARSGYL